MRQALASLVAGVVIVVACSDESRAPTAPLAPSAAHVAAAAAARLASLAPRAEHATSSDAFVNSIGTNVHLSYWHQAYGWGLYSIIRPRLQALGIRHVRDEGVVVSMNSWMATEYGNLNWLHRAAGVTFDLITAPASNTRANYRSVPLRRLLNYIQPGAVEALEGLNEMDDHHISNWASLDRTWQQALYRAAKSDPRSRHLAILGPTVTHGGNAARALGDLSAFEDFGAMHPYPGGRKPEGVATASAAVLEPANFGRRYYVTETGYHTGASNRNQPFVSNLAMGKYVPRLFLRFFNDGIVRTYTYQLLDGTNDPWDSDHFGLLTANGTPKPAYNALKNLIGLLADPGGGHSTGSLSYSLNGAPATINHSLFQKRNGRFYLALWQEVATFGGGHDLANRTVPVHITLANRPHQLNLYTPLNSAAGRGLAATNALTIQVPDHVVVLEVVP